MFGYLNDSSLTETFDVSVIKTRLTGLCKYQKPAILESFFAPIIVDAENRQKLIELKPQAPANSREPGCSCALCGQLASLSD
jgi:hypothetical protein